MSSSNPERARSLPDVSACEREPIHIPGSIEPNGALLVLSEPELTIVQATANAKSMLGRDADALLGTSLGELLVPASIETVRERLLGEDLEGKRRHVSGIRLQSSQNVFGVLVHRHEGLLIVEFEPTEDSETGSEEELHVALTNAIADLEGHSSLADLCQRVAVHVRRLAGFDRVMVYRFLEDDSGSVEAEDRRPDLTPYRGLRYPASDIPAQARRLYLLNTLRLKADVNAARVPVVPSVNPITGRPLDMSHCILRAMSPVHDEYLRNMGVTASMSVSIVKDERLWGLISCHHTSPKRVPHSVRISCEVLARVFSAEIGAAEDREREKNSSGSRALLETVERQLRAGDSNVRAALLQEGDRLAAAANAQGLAVVIGGQSDLIGQTPEREDVENLVAWLDVNQQQHILCTQKLSEIYQPAERFAPHVTGLLSARVALGSNDFVLWFRPAALKVIVWAGDPNKPVTETDTAKRLSPRNSFEAWKQTVGDRSEPWQDHEHECALGLRRLMAEMLLVQKNQQITGLNVELERSNIELDAFAYAASHDLQEPIRTIRSYTQLFARRAGSKLNDEERDLLKTIEAGATRMGSLVSALLTFGQVGGSGQRERKLVNLKDLLRWVLMNLEESVKASQAKVTHDELPTVTGDPEQLTQIWQNLIGNSIKYKKVDEAPRVHISVAQERTDWLFGVRDNGQGFEANQAEIIFGAFKRLHGKDIPGTGIGLTLCKRIVEHHGGRIWAESKGKGHGSTFWFTLPQSNSQ